MTSSYTRLHVRGIHLGFKRNRRNQHCGQSRIQIEGLRDRKDTPFYMGKRIAYIYKGTKDKKMPSGKTTKYRVMWGRVIAAHGGNGVVRAKFRKNLPASSIGRGVRVMLYPSNI